MAVYTNLTDVNVVSSIVCPSVTLTTANVTKANFVGAASGLTATAGWTNTNANFAELTNTVSNIISILKGLT